MAERKPSKKEEDFSNRCILSELENGVTPERGAVLKKMMDIHCQAQAKRNWKTASRP